MNFDLMTIEVTLVVGILFLIGVILTLRVLTRKGKNEDFRAAFSL